MNTGFNYVNIVSEGCEGWLNLFHGENIICLVEIISIADEIRETTPERVENKQKHLDQECPIQELKRFSEA